MLEEKTRRLFIRWLTAREGGAKSLGSARSYCSYLTKSFPGQHSVFELGTGRILTDFSQLLFDLSSRLLEIKGNGHSALLSFVGFVNWISENSYRDNIDVLLAQLTPSSDKEVRKKKTGSRSQHVRPARDLAQANYREIDAYQEFFSTFRNQELTPESFYVFGLEKSIYADDRDVNVVGRQFDLLFSLLRTGNEAECEFVDRKKKRRFLSIRKYSGDKEKSRYFVDLYAKLFPRARIVVETSGNTHPKANITYVTGCKLYSRSEAFKIGRDTRKLLKNYQCSHFLDDRTKNPLLFEAVWNLVLTPKMIDPLTGHETLGRWPMEFQRLLKRRMIDKFGDCMRKYNEYAERILPDVERYAKEVAVQHKLSHDAASKFVRDAISQWLPIDMNVD